MGPKKKKKSGKKGGKKGEPQVTFNEAILAYKIGLVEKQLEDWKFEEKNILDQNERLKERNERLLAEQEQYIKIMLKQNREFNKKDLLSEKVGKDKVMEALEDKWEGSKDEEKKLEALQAEILNMEKTIAKYRRELQAWLNFKQNGSVEKAKQIELLEKELRDMQESYEEMSDHLSRNLEVTKSQIVNKMETTLDQQKHNASEQAMATLDKKDRQEVLDNDWMIEEVRRYEVQCAELLEEVGKIEAENLALMEDLFDSNVDGLRVTKSMFLTQFDGTENLEDGGILEVDLKQVSLIEREKSKAGPSGWQPMSLERRLELMKEDDLDSSDDERYDGRIATPDSDTEDPFHGYYSFNDQDIEDYLQLGPVELKLLSLSGEPKPLHGKGNVSNEEIAAQDYAPGEWPVTQPMLKAAMTPRGILSVS